MPPAILAWADALRRRYYPPERNRLRAHVTLFHALPPSAEGEIRRLLADHSRERAPDAWIAGIMNLGRGTALDVDSPGMVSLHEIMSERLHGLLTAQDSHPLRLHITVQNKVQPAAARALQAELGKAFERRVFRFRGFGLYAWGDGFWREIAQYPFRG